MTTLDPVLLKPQGQFTPLAALTLNGLVNAFIIFSLVISSTLFIFALLFGGIKIIISGGKKDKMDEAGRQIVNALIGILIVFSTWAVLSFVSYFFGINLSTFEIPTL